MSHPDDDPFRLTWQIRRAAYRRIYRTWEVVKCAPEIWDFEGRTPTIWDCINRAIEIYCDDVEKTAKEHGLHKRLEAALKRIY